MQAISALLGIGCPVGQQKDTTVGSPTYNQCVSSAVLAANAQAAMLAKLLGTKAPVVAKKSNNDWLIAGGIGIAVLAVVVLVATRK
jgi:hypothetical protein